MNGMSATQNSPGKIIVQPLVLWGVARQERVMLTKLGFGPTEAELREIMDSIHLERGMAAEPLFKRQYRLPIFLAVTIGLFNQLSGINAVL